MTKRAWSLAAVGVACSFVLAACGDQANPIQPSGVGVSAPAGGTTTSAAATTGASSGKEVKPAETGGASAVNAELARIRQATAAFHDVSKAVGAGYTDPATGLCDSNPDGAGIMGIHSLNLQLFDGQIEPLEPEGLLYLPKPEGGFRLIGVEYLLPVLLRNKQTGTVAARTEPGPWDPALYEVVNSAPQVAGANFQGPMPGHFPGMPWHWDLHVWVWSPNPSGMFVPWNTGVSCPQ